MCGDHNHPSSSSINSSSVRGLQEKGEKKDDSPPDWKNMSMPPSHILRHLIDAHCHPTDLTHPSSVYDDVQLGGIAAMATIFDDQDKVKTLSQERGWYAKFSSSSSSSSGEVEHLRKRGKEGKGVGVVACFGYHPWFTHMYTLQQTPPSKESHYFSLFLPQQSSSSSYTRNKALLESLLPYLPKPIPFQPLLDKLRQDIEYSLTEGRLTMLGEVGLDGSSRMRWPIKAKCLHPDYKCRSVAENQQEEEQGGCCPNTDDPEGAGQESVEEEEEWKRLTPFKVPLSHQRSILDLQLEIAIELGVNVSFHSVSAAGPSYDTLVKLRDNYGQKFTNRINVDIHSAGGWSPEFWKQAERNLNNLYASPSIFITSRSPSASSLIKAISPKRMLVESDSDDVRLSSRLVWAATEWISRIKGWKLENGEQEWSLGEDDDVDEEEIDEKGNVKDKEEGEIWTVRLLELNWARFMRMFDQ